MSSTRFAKPLHANIKSSWRLLALMSVLFAGALVLIVPLALVLPAKLLLTVSVVLGYVISLNRLGWFSVRVSWLPFFYGPVKQLVWRQDGQWRLVTRGDQFVDARLLPSTTVNQLFLALNFMVDDMPWYRRYRSVVVLPDSVNADELRQLRVRLLTEGLSQGQSQHQL